MDQNHPLVARRAAQFGETIFTEFTALAIKHGAVNLGQGFPDFDPPDFVLEALREATVPDQQQYARGPGHPELVEALAAQAERSFGRPIDPLAEITITVGATEGLFTTIQALVDPGDEVVLLEPFYDCYPADVAVAGGIARYVPLRPDREGQWQLDAEELKRAFCARTKLIVLNTPHNPTGKVFSRAELELIAELCQRHDALALCDEVYEWIVFDDHRHLRLATIPGMWERTVTLSSAGKTFSVTGWKVGWAVASPALSTGLRKIHQWVPFSVATPLQRAVADAARGALSHDYYPRLSASYQAKRDKLVGILDGAGLRPFVPQGTYFVVADTSAFDFADDVAFCRHLTCEVGVGAIPPSAFYSEPNRHLARHHARFCFCKRDQTLDAAAARLASLG